MIQAIIDMRRGADLLLARKDVDPKRLAYVGHSYNATVGGILSGCDHRFKAFVLMAGGLSSVRRTSQRRLNAILTATKGSHLPRTARLTTLPGGLCILMLLASIHLPAQTQSTKSPAVPEGWLLAGSNPRNYETGLDPQASYHGFPSAYLKAKQSAMEGFGTLMQQFSAGQYAGRRVRLRASVKAEEVADWAGLWMRVRPAEDLFGYRPQGPNVRAPEKSEVR